MTEFENTKSGADVQQPARGSSQPASGKPESAIICWGGDVNLGRRQHYRTEEIGVHNVLDLPAMRTADLRIVNLECVVSTCGQFGIDKGESGPFYYRARPEMLHILRAAGIDVVAVANNHSGDYGREALIEQGKWLDTFAIKHAGAGNNIHEAFEPCYAQAGPYRIAFFSFDTTQHRFAATENAAGIAYLDIQKPDLWRRTLEKRILEARGNADLVLIALHWGKNFAARPTEAEIALGHTIIDLGADAVLGSSAHILQGTEIYKGKPIIYDAGNLLFDSIQGEYDTGVFRLHVDSEGVYRVQFAPARARFGHTHELPQAEAAKISENFAALCSELGSAVELEDDGSATLTIRECCSPPRQPESAVSREPFVSDDAIASALATIGVRNEWIAREVPADARLDNPIRLGPLVLLGLRCSTRKLTGRAMLWVESFWICLETPTANWRLDIRAVSNDRATPVVWGGGMDHDPCDWMLPTTRWQPRQIYRDYVGLRPPASNSLRNAQLDIEVGLVNPL
ncbi:CapA family protein [Chelativorans intermedius]|uniref:CapA family protein n=1 Tax=Chelativorans intermedius TaxID=515947 RepID=A0ABV6D769_9HYPH|nr:CapA family protein [Chelativorans intermedius]MCT8999488.1 CapA family protein [Chelativorans intermedius]